MAALKSKFSNNMKLLELISPFWAISPIIITLEGLLENVLDKIIHNPMASAGALPGDSATNDSKDTMEKFKSSLREMIAGTEKFTFILDDPAGNSYVQNL